MITVTEGQWAARRARLAVVLGLVVVALLGGGVLTGWAPQLRLDASLGQAFYAGDDRSTAVSVLLEVLTAPGLSVSRAVVFLPVLVWLLTRHRWWTAGWVALATVGVGVLNSGLKELVGRVRPDFAEGGARYDSLSFPSGHSAGIACLVTTALVLAWPRLTATARRRWLAAGVALVLVVGATRVLLGVHFPSDVLAGWAFGTAWTLLVALLLGGLPGGRAALPGREAG